MKLSLLNLVKFLVTLSIIFGFGCTGKNNPIKNQNNAPIITIVQPINTINYNFGDTIFFMATVEDSEDGTLSDSSIIWTSDIDGQIGIGSNFSISSLSNTKHVITITAIDSDSGRSSTELIINIGVTFTISFGTERNDYSTSIIKTSDSEFVMTGRYGYDTYSSHMFLSKIDNYGSIIWNKVFDKAYSGVSVIESSNGGYVIAAKKYQNISLINTDSDGNILWEKSYLDTLGRSVTSVCKTSDGGYVITGWYQYSGDGFNHRQNTFLMKTDSHGNVVWNKRLDFVNSQGFSVIETSEGDYLLAGHVGAPITNSSIFSLSKFDVDGNQLWLKTFDGGVVANSVIETINGDYVIAGRHSIFDVYLVRTDKNGDVIWYRNFGGGNNETGKSVYEFSDESLLVTGSTESFGAVEKDVYIFKIDKSGSLIWETAIGGANDDIGNSVVGTSDGGALITGSTNSFGAGLSDVYLIRTDSLGIVY